MEHPHRAMSDDCADTPHRYRYDVRLSMHSCSGPVPGNRTRRGHYTVKCSRTPVGWNDVAKSGVEKPGEHFERLVSGLIAWRDAVERVEQRPLEVRQVDGRKRHAN